MAKDPLSGRLRALTAFRALFVTVLLGTFLIFEIGYGIFPYPREVLYLIISLYILTIAYALLLRKAPSAAHAYLQLALDVLSAIALIFLTGGIESWFTSVLMLVVIAAAIVLGKRAGYITATLGGVFYGLLIDFQFYGILHIPFDPLLGEKDILYNIFSHIVALYLTAYLTGYLSSRLERVTTRLEKKSLDLRDLALFNREVIEAMPSGLFTTNLGGRVLLFNRAAEETTGIEQASAAGRHISEIMPFVSATGETHRVEGTLRAKDKERVIGLTISKMRDARGTETGYIGIFDDLTDIKRLEEEIKQKERLADIGELAANIAHEIRNPLASLKGSIEMLRENMASPEHKSRLMDIALGEMNRLNSIITDFLNYSRPKPIEPVTFDLNQLIGETVEMLGKMDDADGITFIKNLNGGLVLRADPQRLQQVFWNLGINAVEAMTATADKPGGKGSLVVSTNIVGGPEGLGSPSVEIVFEDTGPGVSPENMKKVFYPFFTTKDKGTGLGLSIAYRIIEDHGGGISLSNRPGGGARFKIILPKGLESPSEGLRSPAEGH